MSVTFTDTIETLFEGRSSVIARDLKVNLKRHLEGGAVTREEALLTLLAVATSLEMSRVAAHAADSLEVFGISREEIQEAADNAAIMGMLNTYYRFKHMTEHPDDYKAAGLRMTVFANPVLGKTRFEMLSFAVSVLNACESCVRSHEQALRQLGVPAEKLHDLARIASIAKGIKGLGVGG